MEIPKEGDENELSRLKALVWIQQIQTAFQRRDEASGAGEADRDEAESVEASHSAKAAKKNRKEKERRARRKREQKTGGTSDDAVTDPAEIGVQGCDQGVEERLDLVVEQHDIETGTASEGVLEATTPIPSVQAGEDASIRQAANEPNRPAKPPAEPHMLATPPTQDAQLTLPSPPPTIDPQTTPPTTSTTSGTRKTSRRLMTPAVPFNLRFTKKSSTTMQHEKPDTQSSATEQESDSAIEQIAASTAELTLSKAQAATEDTPETEVADAGMEAKQSPEGPLYETKSPIPATHVAESSESSAPVPAQAPVVTTSPTQSSEASTPAPAQAPAETTSDTTRSSEAATPAPAQAPAETTSRATQSSELSSPAPAQAAAEATSRATQSSELSSPAPAQAAAEATPHTTQSSAASTPAPAQAPAEATPHTTQISEASAPAPASAQAPAEITSHTTQSAEASTPAPAQAPAQQRLVKFDTYEWPCRNQECRKLTSPYDESTVICPRCGPYSLIRYCSKKCLFDDLLMHWGVECGSFTLAQRADPMTITKRQISIQPYIPSLTHIDRPERFRQFVRHSIDTTGDYFVFSDWADWRNAGFRMPWPAEEHASGSILAIVNFTQTGSSVPSRMLFTRLLRICFLVGGARTDMAYFLFKMIIGRLTELGLATSDIKNCLVWQFKHEFAYPGGFADLLMDQQVVNWPLVAGQVVQLENQYRSFLVGGVHLGPEWSNKV